MNKFIDLKKIPIWVCIYVTFNTYLPKIKNWIFFQKFRVNFNKLS